MRSSFEKKIVVGFALALGFMAVMGATAVWSAKRFAATFRWVDHTHAVLYQLEASLTDLLNMQTATRGFLLTGHERFLEPYETGSGRIEDGLRNLRELTKDNPIQRERLSQAEDLGNRLAGIMRERIAERRRQGSVAATEATMLDAGNEAIASFRAAIAEMQAEERRLLGERSTLAQFEQRRATLVFGLGTLAAIGIVTAAGLVVRRDFRHRQQAERERDRFFSLTIDLLCVAGFDGYFKRLNPAWEKTLGFTNEELLAKPYMEFVHPDDRERTREQASLQAGGANAISFENRYLCKDGSYRWLEWNARSLVDEKLIFATAHDITDRKRFDEIHLHFRALFESLPGLYLVLTPDLRIVGASDAYLKATMTSREQILGRGLFEVFPDNPGDPAATGTANLRASLERVGREGVTDTMAIQKYDVRRPDGIFEERFWSPVNSPVFGLDRRLEYIIHRVEDVTDFIRQKQRTTEDETGLRTRLERMEAEVFQSSQQVQLANQRLHATNAELEAFCYSVSHDLRAPLRHIDGFTGLLQKHAAATLDEKGLRYLATISTAARQMGRLIDDLLSFSRMGRAQMQLGEVDQQTLVAAVVRDGRFDKPDRPIEWVIAPLPRMRADHAMLQQVWVNLLDNAVKYSGKVPRPRIEIGHRADPAAGEHVFFVRDNGAGFDMRYADKLFGVFQRLHGPAEFEGTGIGLANVRRIIARHGGRTWAEGQVDAGATFYFSLPLSPAAPIS